MKSLLEIGLFKPTVYKNWSQLPDGSSLLDGPIDLSGRSSRNGAWKRLLWVTVVKCCSACEDPISETSWNNNVVVLRCLISCDKHRIRLSDMNIYWVIRRLYSVSSLNFNQFHDVALNPKVECVF